MPFAHDTEVALVAASALINTDAADGDQLTTVAALDAFLGAWRWTGSRRHNRAELDAVRALRPRLRELWEAGEDHAAVIVNTLLREAAALPQLVKHDEWSYHLHAVPAAAPLDVRMSVEAAMAVVDIIRLGELERLGICAADDCTDTFVDLTKNRSRRYCDRGCGNRANVAAYRERRSGGQPP